MARKKEKLEAESSSTSEKVKDGTCDMELGIMEAAMSSIVATQNLPIITNGTQTDEKENSESGTMTKDIYSFFLAIAYLLPGFLQKKPFLFFGIAMPFIDATLDFISTGIV